jgi:hypothetical protein
VPTLSSFWLRPAGRPGSAQRVGTSPVLELIGVIVLVAVVATGIAVGTAERTGRVGAANPSASTLAAITHRLD